MAPKRTRSGVQYHGGESSAAPAERAARASAEEVPIIPQVDHHLQSMAMFIKDALYLQVA